MDLKKKVSADLIEDTETAWYQCMCCSFSRGNRTNLHSNLFHSCKELQSTKKLAQPKTREVAAKQESRKHDGQ